MLASDQRLGWTDSICTNGWSANKGYCLQKFHANGRTTLVTYKQIDICKDQRIIGKQTPANMICMRFRGMNIKWIHAQAYIYIYICESRDWSVLCICKSGGYVVINTSMKTKMKANKTLVRQGWKHACKPIRFKANEERDNELKQCFHCVNHWNERGNEWKKSLNQRLTTETG